jgi:hypothetical protein
MQNCAVHAAGRSLGQSEGALTRGRGLTGGQAARERMQSLCGLTGASMGCYTAIDDGLQVQASWIVRGMWLQLLLTVNSSEHHDRAQRGHALVLAHAPPSSMMQHAGYFQRLLKGQLTGCRCNSMSMCLLLLLLAADLASQPSSTSTPSAYQ